jgi:hypothetical protein
MLPLTLAYVVIIATVTLLLDVLGVARGSLPYTLALLALNIVLLGLVFVLLDRGRLISPASARARESEVQRLRALARARVARARGGRSGALASDVAGD